MKLILITALLFTSCGPMAFSLSPDGCAWKDSVDTQGNPYSMALCLDETVKVKWKQADNSTIMAVKKKGDKVKFYIVNADGSLTPFTTNEPPIVPRTPYIQEALGTSVSSSK